MYPFNLLRRSSQLQSPVVQKLAKMSHTVHTHTHTHTHLHTNIHMLYTPRQTYAKYTQVTAATRLQRRSKSLPYLIQEPSSRVLNKKSSRRAARSSLSISLELADSAAFSARLIAELILWLGVWVQRCDAFNSTRVTDAFNSTAFSVRLIAELILFGALNRGVDSLEVLK